MKTLSTKLTINKDLIQSPNLCDRFDETDLSTIGTWVYEGYQRDLISRLPWERRMTAAMDYALQVQKAKSFPWPNCSNVVFPLITIAALQFSARSYSNIIQGTDVVRYRTLGSDPDGKLRARADRIGRHMSWQVLEEDLSWEEQHDRLLINLSIVGTSFIKSFNNGDHNTSELVMARDLVINYWAKSTESASRLTQRVLLHRNDIYEGAAAGIYRDVLDELWFKQDAISAPISQPADLRQGITIPPSDQDTPFRCLEQHRLLDLDGDGYAEPYIVTTEETSQKVLRITARFEREEDVERNISGRIMKIRPVHYFTKYPFIPSPDGGMYDVGFGILLGPLNEAVSTGINQILDAGTMHNSNGGFLGKGTKMRGGAMTFAPWEWKPVPSTGDDLRKSMVPFPVREPSNVMFQLVGLLIEYTDRIAGTTDNMVGENPGQNTPAETSRNMTEQGMQVYNVIFKRIWRSMKEEFKKLYRLNSMFLESSQRFGAQESLIHREDYKSNPDLVAPVADPNITSSGMRMMQVQLLRQAAHTVPGYNIPLVEKKFLTALKIDDIEDVYPGPDKVPPLPNPKMQVEEMKLQGQKMKFDHEKQMTVMTLMSARAKTDAEIKLIHAQILEIVKGVQNADAELKLKHFEAYIDSLKAHSEMLGNSIETLATYGGKGGEDSDGTGVGGMGAGAGNAGASKPPAQVGGGAA
jgi:chaperonin GroES